MNQFQINLNLIHKHGDPPSPPDPYENEDIWGNEYELCVKCSVELETEKELLRGVCDNCFMESMEEK